MHDDEVLHDSFRSWMVFATFVLASAGLAVLHVLFRRSQPEVLLGSMIAASIGVLLLLFSYVYSVHHHDRRFAKRDLAVMIVIVVLGLVFWWFAGAERGLVWFLVAVLIANALRLARWYDELRGVLPTRANPVPGVPAQVWVETSVVLVILAMLVFWILVTWVL